MKRKRLLSLTVALLLLVTALTGCSGGQKSGAVKVGVRGNIPGFGYQNPISETYSGMEVDLAKMLADAMGYGSVEFVGVTVDSREEVLESGEVDFLAADFTITDERLEEFDFSPAYYHDNVRVMVEGSTGFTTISDLKGKRIGVRSGSTAGLVCAQALESNGVIPAFDHDSFDPESFDGGVTFVGMETYEELDAALEDGSIDALCSDFSILNGHMDDDRILLAESLTEQEIGICTAKDSELTEQISKYITQWTEDGTLEELIAKWDLN